MLTYAGSGPMAGMQVGTTDALGNATTHEYDAVGSRTKTIDPLGNVVGGIPAEHWSETVYDNEDCVRFSKGPAPQAGGAPLITEFPYDAVGKSNRPDRRQRPGDDVRVRRPRAPAAKCGWAVFVVCQ